MDTRLPEGMIKTTIRRPRSERGTGFFDVALAKKTARKGALKQVTSRSNPPAHVSKYGIEGATRMVQVHAAQRRGSTIAADVRYGANGPSALDILRGVLGRWLIDLGTHIAGYVECADEPRTFACRSMPLDPRPSWMPHPKMKVHRAKRLANSKKDPK